VENLTRRKVITAATTIAIVTIAVVMVTKLIGAIVIASFLAGAGVTLVVGLVILAGVLTNPAGRKK
jgi:hypothetical protein